MLKPETIDGAAPYGREPEPTIIFNDPTGDLLEERAQKWGNPVNTHIAIAEVWSGILGHDVNAHEVALCMAGLKLVRASLNPDDPDSLDDAAGYIRIGQLVMKP